MKIVNIIGGLGNQMFQYALVVVLSNRFKENVLVDVKSFNTYKLHNGLELENVFGIKLHKASLWQIWKVSKGSSIYLINRILKKKFPRRKTECVEFPLANFDKAKLYDPGNMYYEGNWQHWRYFEDYKEEIIKTYKFIRPLEGKAKVICDIISNCNSVSIHIRRGDYLKEPKYCNICTLDYYKKACEYIKNRVSNPHFFVFSDDLEWCKDNLVQMMDKYTLVDCNKGNESYRDMQLMSMCKYMILANSSFSWWAAYLNKRQIFVIAPQTWINSTKSYKEPRQLPEWILI